MEMRYQIVLQSSDGQQDYNTTDYLKRKPSLKFAERFFKGQIKPGMRLTLDTHEWDNDYNEPYQLYDRETLKEY